MMRTLRAFFLSRALREKLLLVAFCAIGVVIWAANFSDRANRFWRAQRGTTAALNEQEGYLKNQKEIEAQAQKAASQLVPEKTLDGTRLFTTISQLATEAGLSSKLREDPPALPVVSGQLSINTLRFTLNNVDWEPLTKFYLALHERSPYIVLQQVQLMANRANPAQVTMVGAVSSVEVRH
jgi:hypothetical protein